MVCLFSSTFDTKISLVLSIFRRSDPRHLFIHCWPYLFSACPMSQPLHLLSRSCRLAEELYLVFIACSERLLCRAAKYSSVQFSNRRHAVSTETDGLAVGVVADSFGRSVARWGVGGWPKELTPVWHGQGDNKTCDFNNGWLSINCTYITRMQSVLGLLF